MSEAAHDPEVANVEAALMGLTPRSAGIDRDRLMFRAGQAAQPRRNRFWPGVTAALAFSTATLAVLLALRSPTTIERYVYVPVARPAEPGASTPTPTPAVTPSPAPVPAEHTQVAAREKDGTAEQAGLLKMRDEVLRWGVEALPPSSPVAYSDPPKRDSLPGMPLDKLDQPGAWHHQLQ